MVEDGYGGREREWNRTRIKLIGLNLPDSFLVHCVRGIEDSHQRDALVYLCACNTAYKNL